MVSDNKNKESGARLQVYQEDVLSEDGLLLTYYRWIPSRPKAAVIISHGWSEHAGRYDAVARWFANCDYEVHALDHRGHGQSAGSRGHTANWSDYTRDLEQLRLSVDQEHQYLIGHSMGGMISILHLLEYPERFKAVALSGPASDLSIQVPKTKYLVSKTLCQLWPTLSLKNDIDPSWVCSDKSVVDAYIHDPFNHGRVSVSWFVNYLQEIERVKAQAALIETPLGIWHGSEDKLVEPWVSEQFFQRLGENSKVRTVVEGAYHELLYEPNWKDTVADIKQWLERH